LTLFDGRHEGHPGCKELLSGGAIAIQSLAPVNPDWFYLSGTNSPGRPRQRAIKQVLLLLLLLLYPVPRHQ